MAISSITRAELAHGVEKSTDQARKLAVVEDFVGPLNVLSYDDRAAWQYGIIRAALERQGTPIGVNDLHIAGHARSLGLIIAARLPTRCENQRGKLDVKSNGLDNLVQMNDSWQRFWDLSSYFI